MQKGVPLFEANGAELVYREMTMRRLRWGAVCGVLWMYTMLSGCATVSVDRGKSVSAAGVAYSQAVSAVVDVAIDASIDASSQRRGLGKPRQVVPPADQPARATELKTIDDELVGTVVRYTRLKRSLSATEAYFIALQQLAEGSTAEATETAVKSLADQLNGINNALDKGDGVKPLIGEERKGAIAGLSRLVVKQVHGAQLVAALERDADVIGRTLVLHEMVLQAAENDIQANLTDAASRFYAERVRGPYQRGEIGDTWVDDRRHYIKVRALGSSLASIGSAHAAAQHMQTVWARILSGETSAKELTAMLKDTQELLVAVAALKSADAK